VDDLQSVASDVDVLYMTRIQKERFTNMDEYAAARGELWGWGVGVGCGGWGVGCGVGCVRRGGGL